MISSIDDSDSKSKNIASSLSTPVDNLPKFDVNTFLKKTLSNFDLENSYSLPTTTKNDSEICKNDENCADFLKNDESSADNDCLLSNFDHHIAVIDKGDQNLGVNNEKLTYQDNTDKNFCDNNSTIDNEIMIKIDSYDDKKLKICAYCGVNDSAFDNSPLYCDSCYHLFTVYGRSEIKKRLLLMIKSEEAAIKDDKGLPGGASSKDQGVGTDEGVDEIDHRMAGTTGILKDNVDSDSTATETVPLRQEQDRFAQSSYQNKPPRRRRSRRDMLEQSRNLTTRQNSNPNRIYQSPARCERPVRKSISSRRPMSRSPPYSDDPRLSRQKGGVSGGSRVRGTSWSSSSSIRPACRICQMPGEVGESLITPCRCSGTMQYIHTTCLVHWLEVSSKKAFPIPQCELCGYRYRTHHCYKLHRFFCPQCSHHDKILHLVFFIMALVMIGCTALSVMYLRMEKGRIRSALTAEDIVVIACSLLFFSAFFVAVFTQYRAQTSLCRLLLRCWTINRHWRVKDYDQMFDVERKPGPTPEILA